MVKRDSCQLPPGIRFHRVSEPPLSRYVDSIWLFEDFVQIHGRERVLPTGTMDLVLPLNQQGPNEAQLAGVRSGNVIIDTGYPLSLVAVHFKPGGGFAFFDPPAGELTDRIVSLDSLWGGTVATLHEQLLEANTAHEKIGLVFKTLLRKFNGREGHPAVAYALREFRTAGNTKSVAEICLKTGLSHRSLIQMFRNQAGAAPKFFQRICRFNLVIDMLAQCNEPSWANIAVACGYFDQAHFNHDFHRFSGINPTTYLQSRVTSSHVRIAG